MSSFFVQALSYSLLFVNGLSHGCFLGRKQVNKDCHIPPAIGKEASYFDRFKMIENGLEYDRKKFTPTNVSDRK